MNLIGALTTAHVENIYSIFYTSYGIRTAAEATETRADLPSKDRDARTQPVQLGD